MEVPELFDFPFEPYQIQKDFMRELYFSLETSKLAIFESPTGTGKSLSICCGALKWLKDHEKFERSNLMQKIEELALASQTSDSVDGDWLTEEYDRIKKTTEKNSLSKKLDELDKQVKRINDLKLHKSKTKDSQNDRRKKIIENSIKSKKEMDKNSLNNEDILNHGMPNIEELPDDDKDLLLEEITQDNDDDFDDNNDLDEEVEDEGVKIFFCSRTHSQLSQFVNEIKRTSFATDIRVVSLASRQQYCINKSVVKLKNSALINERCLDLQKNKSGKTTSKSEDGKAVKKSKCSSGCHFYNQTNIEILRDEALIEIKDVEDLVTAAKEIQSCPYYSARAAVRYAQVVVLPYQTVLHEATRRANGINLKNNILIIDEAHNLLDSIGHIHSAEISGHQLRTSVEKLKQYRDKYNTRFAARNLLQLNQVIFIVGKILGVLKRSTKPNDTKITKENKIFTIEEFVLHAEIDNYNIRPLLKFCTQSKLSQKLHGFSLKYPFQEMKSAKDESKSKGLESFLCKISNTKKPESTELVKTEEIAQHEKYISVGNAVQSVLNFLTMLTNKYTDGRISTLIAQSVDEGYHKFMLLNPAAQFADIVKDARAIIVAGGTMQPFSEFRDQLFLSAGASRDRITDFSCDHVIPPENILPICLSEGPSGKRLNFSYEMRNTPEMLNEFGRILQNVCNVVPGGVVCFFPSYEYEKTVYDHLQSNGTLQKINTKKKVFREPKTTGQVDQVLEEYSKVIKKSKNTNFTGALMLSVIGGKLSEGLNFSDDLGRCIIVIGMPYPNKNSVELKEKMKYLNENISTTAGNAHYENLCLKAINQCIGRAVRHAKDYASVILIDERYSRDNVKNSLPKWIQRSLVTNAKFGAMFGSITKFFAKHKMKL